MKKFIVVLATTTFLTACAIQPAHRIQTSLSDGQALDFTGKGAGAGMMLDAVMGGTGIAIGIAIDKGIANDINSNLSRRKPAFNIVELFNEKLQSTAKTNRLKLSQPTQLTIERFGFKTVPDGEDNVSAWLEIKVTAGEMVTRMEYPKNFEPAASAPLSSVKENPDAAFNLLDVAAEQIAKRIVSDVQK